MSLLSSSFSYVGLAERERTGLEMGHVPEQQDSDGSVEALTGLRRVEPCHGAPWDAQESSGSRRQVLQGQGGGEGKSWMVWGVFP